MKFLTNTFNPAHKDARRYLVYRSNEDRESQWQAHLLWLADKYIGDPQKSDYYSVQELINMDMVGVYALD